MERHELIALAMVVVVGITAQWIAWRIRLPAIVLLLLGGIVMGPVTGFLDPDAILGNSVVPIVSLSVAIILFEGGMSLHVRELRGTGGPLTMLVTVGAAVTWALCALFAVWVLGLDQKLATLLGAVLIVTGPTVIGPLLRHVRPVGKSGTVLKWEGLAIDPIGAIAAVLTFEFLFAHAGQSTTGDAIRALLETFAFGTLFGLGGALFTVVLLKKFWVPDFLINPVSVALVVLVYVGSNWFQAESGIIAVTLMGFVLANQRWVKVGHILEFKENLRVLLISFLFVILAARLSPEIIGEIRWNHALYILLLFAVVRPISVFLSTLGSQLNREERTFIALMAPRGIVAAAVASVFALELGGESGDLLVTNTFLVIISSVVVYGFAALPVARKLKLAQPEPQGLLLVGSSAFSRALGRILVELKVPVKVIDTNAEKVRLAVGAGLNAELTNYLDDDEREEMDVSAYGKMLAVTSNDNANEFLALKGMEDFGRAKVYRLSRKPRNPNEVKAVRYSGRVLFDEPLTFQALQDRMDSGWTMRSEAVDTKTEDEWKSLLEMVVPLVVIGPDGQTEPVESRRKPPLREGHTIVYMALDGA